MTMSMSSDREEDVSLQQDESSEDEFDWEEVEVPEHQPQHLEITFQVNPKTKSPNKKKGITHAERLIRIDCHKVHTVALIANARVRNKWLNDPLLHARLLSLTPLHLQTAFGAIHKSRVPDQNQRGRMFERAVEALAIWWATTYFEVVPEGHIRNRTFDEIQSQLEIRGLHVPNVNDPDAVLELETLEDIVGSETETIRSEKSIMKHALMASGSRDTSAQLFTALCRALGIPARLVVSIQSVPWQASVGKPKPKYERKPKGKGKEVIKPENEVEESVAGPSSTHWEGLDGGQRLDGEAAPPKSEKAKGKEKAKPVIKLRKQKSKGHVLGAPRRLESPDPLTTPPVFWTEVFSRPDSKWFPVDPVRGLVNKRKGFDPTPSNVPAAQPQYLPGSAPSSITIRRFPGTRIENRMVYVLAFEEDGYARDVTRRYAREYGAKVAKVQGGSSAPNVGGGGKGRQAWWANVLSCIERPYRLHRDDLEDEELDLLQMKEGMPTTIGGFKDHPVYVLARHLKQTETIHPPPPATPELGTFRGEPVYPRSAVVSLKTSENWMRNMGRTVRAGEQPMKMVKVRAGTVNRMRELEGLKDDLRVAGQDDSNEATSSSGPEIMQGLYAYSQTEPYVPEPVVNGKVPKNSFGNIDLYVPSMLPKGAVHIPFKGVAKIARKMGWDYAEAVTGFEFKKRRAFPIIEGIVVAAENEGPILEAFWEAEREAEEKARIKREDRVLKQWTRLIHGLRIRQRLQDQYATTSGKATHEASHCANKRGNKTNEAAAEKEVGSISEDDDNDDRDVPSDNAGGFLAGADRVVQAFHLPKNTHVVLPSPGPPPPSHNTRKDKGGSKSAVAHHDEEYEDDSDSGDAPDFNTYDIEDMDVDIPLADADIDTGGASSRAVSVDYVPKTMQQMAEEAEAARLNAPVSESEEEEIIIGGAVPAAVGGQKQTSLKIALPSKASTPNTRASSRSARGSATPAKAKAKGKAKTPAANGKTRGKAKAKSTPKAKVNGRRGKRARKDAESEEEDDDLDLDEDDDLDLDANEDEDEDDAVDSEAEAEAETASAQPIADSTPDTRKRKRGSAATKINGSAASAPAVGVETATLTPTTTTTTPTTGRTLRPRPAKSPAQLAEERKREAAYRKAVAR
ncbi:Rad4-domain-containing protein [Pholiota conissans]|uniref:Rad4-domain-containing protein n=1 Tax=Pholiota conissans TaxID=109636 RepID=A0A9P6D6N1_9AGAR|nr:Rad4-domain-containing protein [Pholiota conissans]